MIYLDTSALAKLLARAAETDALAAWLSVRADTPQVTSALTRVELIRLARRKGIPGLHDRARYVLDGVDTLPISAGIIEAAATVGDPALRSLDAVHLASAQQVSEHLTAFVVYDRRLAAAADSLGLTVVIPA